VIGTGVNGSGIAHLCRQSREHAPGHHQHDGALVKRRAPPPGSRQLRGSARSAENDRTACDLSLHSCPISEPILAIAETQAVAVIPAPNGRTTTPASSRRWRTRWAISGAFGASP
jgi:hypothetical protein